MSDCLRTLVVSLVLVLAARGQSVPEGKLDEPFHAGVVEPAMKAGDRSLAKGLMKEASIHYLRALWEDPWHADAATRLLEVSAADPASRALWAHHLAAVRADVKGRLRLDRKTSKSMPADDPFPARLALARATALKELEHHVKTERKRLEREGGAGILNRWAVPVARSLMRSSPALMEDYGPSFERLAAPPPRPDAVVIAELERIMTNALGNAEYETAIRAASCLQGLIRQAGFKDLKGPEPPKIDKKAGAAARTLEQARAGLAQKNGDALTVAQLEAMTEAEAETFTREHGSVTDPGVALSPTGLYRVETTCGHETLLGTARTVELHHARLVRWYGKEPFEKRQGLVRVVPEASGLEAEGVPYWWAGGFQRGDVTVVRFSVGTIEGLGHTLTHELTHRFDGALYAFLPSWLVEGRAVWTAAAYARSSDESFVGNHASYGSVESALIKGYGNLDNLERLLSGTVDDFRDNYPAGYSLFLYLTSWEVDGKRLYEKRFETYIKNAYKGRAKPVKWFEKHFADGKDGRPEGMQAFANLFHEFLSGFHWLSRAPWLDRYTHTAGKGPPHQWVYDGPTWTFSRSRAEPWFGQDQARLAGDLFFDLERNGPAMAAYMWSLEVDEWRTRIAERLIGLLEKDRRPELAWLVRFENERRAGRASRDDGGERTSPVLKRLPRLSSYMEALRGAAAHYRDSGNPVAEAAMIADFNRMSVLLGVSPLPFDARIGELAERLHPFDEPERAAAAQGLIEDELTGFDEFRVEGLWYETGDGDLHVGRRKPLEGTGTMERTGHRRHAYVRTRDRLEAGRYRIEARIFFTTSFASGAVVVGHERRDRNVRFHFSAGDYMYSIGQSEEEPKFESFGWSLTGLRSRDGGLHGANARGRFDFEHAKPYFELELVVDGPAVTAFVDGRWVGSYHTIDGLPVEGHVGFGTDRGAIRVQRPTVQRLDRSALARVPDGRPRGLALDRDGDEPYSRMRNLPAEGIPRAETGTVVVWIPWIERPDGEGLDAWEVVDSAGRCLDAARAGLERDRLPQRLVLIVPHGLSPEEMKSLEALGADLLTHRRRTFMFPLDRPNMPGSPTPVLLYVDPHGALRCAEIFRGRSPDLPRALWQWSTVFREGFHR